MKCSSVFLPSGSVCAAWKGSEARWLAPDRPRGPRGSGGSRRVPTLPFLLDHRVACITPRMPLAERKGLVLF